MTQRYYRRIIRITAYDSPNVRLGLLQQRAGRRPSGDELVPGVLGWDELQKRLATWDDVRKCVGLDAQFWLGKDLLLYPPDWLNHSEELARRRPSRREHVGRRCIGCDPAEGGDKSSWSVVDDYGLLKLLSLPTPNTTVVTSTTLALMREYHVEPEDVLFDIGGGGKEHADRLQLQGYDVRAVGFGASPAIEPQRSKVLFDERVENREERYVYVNVRAQMYHEARLLIDPNGPCGGFAIPAEYAELRRQLAPLPLLYDQEGRIKMLPKRKRSQDSKEKCLLDLLGRSPDEADSFVLAIHAQRHRPTVVTAGAL